MQDGKPTTKQLIKKNGIKPQNNKNKSNEKKTKQNVEYVKRIRIRSI